MTYEEFKKLVKEKFAKCMPDLAEAEVDEYINSEEAGTVIEQEYAISLTQLQNGEITETIFRNGSVGAAASCLYMMY
jgi:hypothetical protein